MKPVIRSLVASLEATHVGRRTLLHWCRVRNEDTDGCGSTGDPCFPVLCDEIANTCSGLTLIVMVFRQPG